MPLEKNNLSINFAQGVDTQTDPFQVAPGKFLSLVNSVFQKGRLQKRNGFGSLASLPDDTNIYTTTFNGNLMAIGSSIYAYSSGAQVWVDKGSFLSVDLSTLPLVRSSTNQTQADSVVAPNGIVCTTFTDTLTGSTVYKYVVADSSNGQNLVAPTLLTGTTGDVMGPGRVFLLGTHFVIVFSVTISSTPHLQYIAISVNQPMVVSAAHDITSSYTPAKTVAWDGYVANNNLYLAWDGADGGGAVRIIYLDSTLTLHTVKVFTGSTGTMFSVTADISLPIPVIYISFYNLGNTLGRVIILDAQLNTIVAPTTFITSGTVLNLTSTAINGVCSLLWEVENPYGYDSSIDTNFINLRTVTQAGSLDTASAIVLSVGLATKAFLIGSDFYFMGVFDSLYQPTYFLINAQGEVLCKLAASNAGGYVLTGLPSITVSSEIAYFAYFYRDLLIPINKSQGVTPALQAGVYAQTGVNLATIDFAPKAISSAEIGANLNLGGGFMWGYDGNLVTESNFHVYPDNIELVGSTSSGFLTAQQYYYQVIYQWTDAQGNLFNSAPSPTVGVVTTGSTSSVTVNIPTLRLTNKLANPPKIIIYRWSVAQQIYYQITSVIAPLMNNAAVDSVTFLDTLADSSIIGNSILYTTGGVVENISPPATQNIALFKSRLVLIDSEDRNLLWYSKQVIEATPVEMSDLFTIYIAPTTAAQGSTGPMTALSAMDDKLIIFKKNSIYYITGTGPDNTGANNDFSDPIFITSTVGCSNQQSIVFSPQGLMFQSDKGIWILKRDLSTEYIGNGVEDFNDIPVVSSLNIPGTNEVRFTLSNGQTLMYNYYYGQWGVFEGAPAISATLFQDLHTVIDQYGRVSQETPGVYLDGSNPVVMSFVTSWMNLLGLQAYERAYFFYLLGSYISPHKLQVQVAYDYNSSPQQSVTISPDNYSPAYGGYPIYGSGMTYGGMPSLEQWRVFFSQQKCQAFQISIQELYDPSFGVAAGAGLTLSGINMTIGAKSKYPRIKTANTVG